MSGPLLDAKALPLLQNSRPLPQQIVGGPKLPVWKLPISASRLSTVYTSILLPQMPELTTTPEGSLLTTVVSPFLQYQGGHQELTDNHCK